MEQGTEVEIHASSERVWEVLSDVERVVTELDPGAGFTWVATGLGVRTTASLDRGRRGDRRRGAGPALGPADRAARVVMGRLFLTRLTDRYLATEAAGLKARCEGTS